MMRESVLLVTHHVSGFTLRKFYCGDSYIL
jgi:hypothetical protein